LGACQLWEGSCEWEKETERVGSVNVWQEGEEVAS